MAHDFLDMANICHLFIFGKSVAFVPSFALRFATIDAVRTTFSRCGVGAGNRFLEATLWSFDVSCGLVTLSVSRVCL